MKAVIIVGHLIGGPPFWPVLGQRKRNVLGIGQK
jgi:hypothetical protein